MNTTLTKRTNERLSKTSEIEAVRKHLYNAKGANFQIDSDSNRNLLSVRIGTILAAVHNRAIDVVSQELLRDLGNNYEEACQWYRTYQLIEPFFIRWGNATVVFDRDNPPPVIAEIDALIKTGKVQPEAKEVEDFVKAHPSQIQRLFPHPYENIGFCVWITDKLFVFDSSRWVVNSREMVKYLNYFKLFNSFKAWEG